MSTPIFVAWKGTNPDSIRAAGIGSYGQRFDLYPVDNMLIGIVHSDHPNSRAPLSTLHPNLVVLPGPNSTLSAKHAAHLANSKEFNAKAGDPMRGLLVTLYAKYGDESLNPDAY